MRTARIRISTSSRSIGKSFNRISPPRLAKVELRVYQNTTDGGRRHQGRQNSRHRVHAADTPYLVNNAGFVPVAVVGSDAGAEGNRLDLAVPAKSDIHNLADFKGHTLTCTTPTSITGHRAAVALLLQEAGLRPDIDYSITFSLGQKRSVMGVVDGEYEAAALSHDEVASLLNSGRVQVSDYRVVYQSQVIPRFTIGYVYNLQPPLAAKISQAILDFQNARWPSWRGKRKAFTFRRGRLQKGFRIRSQDRPIVRPLGTQTAQGKGGARK